MSENTGASLVSWAAFGLLPTNAVKAHLSISMPGPVHKFTPLQRVEPPEHIFHPPRQGSAERSYPECQCLEIQILKVSRRKKKKCKVCYRAYGKAGLKPYLRLNCNVCTKFRHIVKIKVAPEIL